MFRVLSCDFADLFVRSETDPRNHTKRHEALQKRDHADLRYFDSGHFALDENADVIADAIIKTFSR